jgi:hypothetical protein
LAEHQSSRKRKRKRKRKRRRRREEALWLSTRARGP